MSGLAFGTGPDPREPTPHSEAGPDAESFESHARLRALCGLLDRIVLGRGAQALLGSVEDLDVSRGLVLWGPPCFGWAHPAVDAGRKTNDGHRRLRLPVRLEWTQPEGSAWLHGSGSLLLREAPQPADPADPADPAESTLWWTTGSMGHRVGACTRLTIDAHAFEPEVTWSSLGTPLAVRLPVMSELEVRSALVELEEDGELAWWELQESLRPMVEVILQRTHRWLGHEITKHRSSLSDASVDEDDWPVFDRIKMTELFSTFCIGEEGRAGKVANAIERLLDPSTMHRVDPLRYLNVNLARDAKDHLRAATGDPFFGWRVRRLQQAEQYADAEALLAAYNEAYPTRRAALPMILDALAFARHSSAAQVPLFGGDESAAETEGTGDCFVPDAADPSTSFR